ncbi:hypothetical protein ACIF8W_18170 [Streptomyces sp. NPDC085639]|uniref:hypothetical protein n=1 Tax=Streptomyces sp. NPDC085639 TaxID=3365734 RepID=UPI0037CF8A2C
MRGPRPAARTAPAGASARRFDTRDHFGGDADSIRAGFDALLAGHGINLDGGHATSPAAPAVRRTEVDAERWPDVARPPSAGSRLSELLRERRCTAWRRDGLGGGRGSPYLDAVRIFAARQ